MNIRNNVSSLIFFAYRVGRPMTEDRSLPKSNIYVDFQPFYSSTGKEADNHNFTKYGHFRLLSDIIIPAVIEFLLNFPRHFIEILKQNLNFGKMDVRY
jgi:hypothetical protein